MRVRTYLIVVLADVEKAFLQIGILKQERDVTRFLWFHDSSRSEQVEGNLDVYLFCRVPFVVHFYWKKLRSFIYRMKEVQLLKNS